MENHGWDASQWQGSTLASHTHMNTYMAIQHTHNLWIYTSHKYSKPYEHMHHMYICEHTHISDLHTWPVTYSARTSDFCLSAPLLKLPWISHWLVSTIATAEHKIPAHCLFFCPACLIAACQNDVSEQSTLLTCLTCLKCAYVIQEKKKNWTCWTNVQRCQSVKW